VRDSPDDAGENEKINSLDQTVPEIWSWFGRSTWFSTDKGNTPALSFFLGRVKLRRKGNLPLKQALRCGVPQQHPQ
jgi:hypothetical protein